MVEGGSGVEDRKACQVDAAAGATSSGCGVGGAGAESARPTAALATRPMKTHARVVVVGGGVMGVGLLYHLTKEGWSDVALVEKGELTSGSTWHAAGLIPHFIASLNMAKVHCYGSRLFQRLEAETGQATGWHGCGSVRLATNRDEADWFHYVQGVLRCVGAECHLIGPSEIADLHPLLDTDGVVLGAYTPDDGHTDPASSTMAMAAGARAREEQRSTSTIESSTSAGGPTGIGTWSPSTAPSSPSMWSTPLAVSHPRSEPWSVSRSRSSTWFISTW